MIFTIIFNLSIIFSAYILQTSFISALPAPFHLISLPLIALILITYIFGLEEGLISAISLGILFNHQSDLFPGSIVLTFLFISILIKFLSDKVFTNKSLYSNTALCVIGSIVQILILYSLNSRYFWTNSTGGQIWINLAWQIILNTVVADILFFITLAFNKELKSYFLTK